jgi:hypothetical protein
VRTFVGSTGRAGVEAWRITEILSEGNEMYAVVGISRLKPGATTEVAKGILGGMREAPGFVSGTVAWSTDGERGRSMMLFESEDEARSALEGVLANMPTDLPIEIESVEVCEVVAHA